MADLPDLIAQLRAAALGRWPRVMPQAVSVPCGDLLRILDAYAEMERALARARVGLSAAAGVFDSAGVADDSFAGQALRRGLFGDDAALQQKDKADE